jgi:putative aldouronate transport system substrate-binding protein
MLHHASTQVSRRTFLKLSAATAATGLLAACVPSVAPQAEPAAGGGSAATDLVYFYGTRATFKDVPLVQEAVSKLLKEKIGVGLQLNPIDWSAFSDKMQLKNAAGEKYDLAFTSTWANNYYDNVKNGVLLDITDSLQKLAPTLYKDVNPGAWDSARIRSKLYAAINQQTWTANFGPRGPKQYADKYGLDWSKVEKLEDMEAFWDAVKSGEPADVRAIGSDDKGGGAIWGVYYKGGAVGGSEFGIIDLDDAKAKAVAPWDFQPWVDSMKLVKKWNDAGYYGKEPWPAADFAAKERAGKYASHFHNNKPGIEAEMKSITSLDFTAKILAKNYLENGPAATMTGVNKQTSNVDACIKYFEMVNTDKQLYNLLCYGIEGTHWVWVDKEKEVIGLPTGVTAENSAYNPNSDWMFGNQFNAYYSDPSKVGAWDATRKLNNEATPSPIVGFVFDQTPVKTEVAQLHAISEEYKTLGIGFLDTDKAIAEYAQRAKDAGADKVLAEVNKQIEEWRAAK